MMRVEIKMEMHCIERDLIFSIGYTAYTGIFFGFR